MSARRWFAVIRDVLAGAIVGVMFGFALVGGAIARIAYDEARLERAERTSFEVADSVRALRLEVSTVRDSLNRVRRTMRQLGR